VSERARWAESGFAGRIGFSRRDVTPPPGYRARSWGPSTTDRSTGVHRPLALTAVAFVGDNGEPLVLVASEIGWWQTSDEEAHVRAGAVEAAGGDPAHVLLHLTHSHSGPTGALTDGDEERAYLDFVRDEAAAAVREAVRSAVPAALTLASGRCGLATNRDLPDGARYVVGFNPDEPADDTVVVGRVADESGRVLGTLVNYACHPTTLAWQNTLISPDFVGAAQEVVEGVAGGPCVFLQGASGDLAPRHQYVGDVEVADRHGRMLGHAAASVLEGMSPPGQGLAWTGVVESGAPLAMWELRPHRPGTTVAARRIEIELDLKPLPTAEELRRRWQGIDPVSLAERQRRAENVRAFFGSGDTFAYPLWVWRLGDCYVAAHPGEAYSQLQTGLRSRHADKAIVVMNLANGPGGAAYLPPAQFYDDDRYQVWQTPYGRGSHERLLEAADAALAEL
jgi:hypothetical protein